MKKISKAMLKNVEIETSEDGFCIWIKEKGKKGYHWLVDGSCLLKDGKIRMGNCHSYKHEAIYNKKSNEIKIMEI